ncbi:MAG TPA: Fe-S protein assembly co-chaperone HscB [Gemmata sp.]|nr:Fe-S protein assembly co-chaperone HscB [Gemmata sp.]
MSDYFQRLGLPRRFSIDEAALERSYLSLSRDIHPDYHLTGSDAELSASLELSAALNEAYNNLRDPFTRADYLLNLEGGPSSSEHKQLPQNFLAEMLEAREEVELARGSSAKVARFDEEFSKRFAAIMAQVEKLFGRYELLSPEDRERVNLRAQVRGLLNAAKYVRGLLRDLHAD